MNSLFILPSLRVICYIIIPLHFLACVIRSIQLYNLIINKGGKEVNTPKKERAIMSVAAGLDEMTALLGAKVAKIMLISIITIAKFFFIYIIINIIEAIKGQKNNT